MPPTRKRRTAVLAILVPALLSGCTAVDDGAASTGPRDVPAWALAIHGGAGSAARDMPAERLDAYRASLEHALRTGSELLDEGGSAVDVVERVVMLLEDDPKFNAGRGAVFNREGGHELDASIMEGRNLACGAVAGVTGVKNPIAAARRVMTETAHVLLAGPGADRFAESQGLEIVPQSYFSTPERRKAWEDARRGEGEALSFGTRGTVGAVALDRNGDLAAATSTGGLTNKRFGRVGDSPIVGAGTYADNASCAVSGTGRGEEYLRHAVARSIAARMSFGGETLAAAVDRTIDEVLRPGDGGVIALGRDGTIVMRFNTPSMHRAAADASGRFEVAIWPEDGT